MQPQGQGRLSQFREAIRSRIQQWLGTRQGEAVRPVRPNAAPQQPGRLAPAPKAAVLGQEAEIKALSNRLDELNRKLDMLLRQSQPFQPQPPVRPNVVKPEAPKAAPPTDGDRPRGFGRFGPGMGGRFGGPDGERSAQPLAPRDGARDGEAARPAPVVRPATELPAVAKIQVLVKAYEAATKDATPQQKRELQRKLLKDIRDLESQQ